MTSRTGRRLVVDIGRTSEDDRDMRHVLLMVLLLGFLSLAVSACGGDDDGAAGGGLSKEDYIAKADAICKAADQRETEADAPGATGQIETSVLEDVVAIDGKALADLRQLKAPENDAKAAKVVSDLGALHAARKDQLAAVRGKDTRAESDAKNAFFTASGDLGVSAGAYGITFCQALGF